MDMFFSGRKLKEKFAQRSSFIKAKVLKSRLPFLGYPKELTSADIFRHTCKGCARVFHKSRGLEWHVRDQHPHLVGQLERDFVKCNKDKITPCKRIMPARLAAPRGAKRYKMALDLNDNLEIKLEQHELDTFSDVNSLLMSSTASDNSLLEISDDSLASQEAAKTVHYSVKKCDILLKNLILAESNNNKVDMNGGTDESDDILIESIADDGKVSEIEIVNLSMSSHHLSSQPSTWSAPEDTGRQAELANLPRLSKAVDKVQWWLSSANFTCSGET